MTAHADAWAAPVLSAVVLVMGVSVVGVVDGVAGRVVAGQGVGWSTLAVPWQRAALALVQQPSTTERPDRVMWVLAPAAYAALAAAGLVVVPWSSTFSIACIDASWNP